MQTTHTRPFLSSALRILVILSILTGAAFVVYDRTRVGAIIGHSLKKLGLSTGAAGATLTVNSTADTDDAGDSLLTLREAIRISNGIRGVGPGETGQVVGPPGGGLDNIVFDVGTGTPTITVTSVLPTISNPVFINGNTGGATRVELSGAALSPTAPSGNNGLTIDGGSCRIRSLVLNRFTNLGLGATAILLLDGGISAGSTVIEDCYIGTNAAGTAALANNLGIEILGSPTNLIGGTAAGTRNVISGNTRDGVSISSGADGNRIEGNYIGTNASGSAAIANGRGITIEGSGVTGNIIGGTAAGARNIISGNGTASDNGTGILLRDGTSANRVEGNYIGTNVSGTLDLGNTAAGVQIGDSATSNVIGGTTAGARNVISGNDREGILIFGTSNRVEGNYIGANAAGTATLGNARSGILLDTAKTNVIGGTTAAARNIISGNSFWGVEFADGSGGVLGTTGNLVQGNYIGSDVTGAIDLGNLLGGVNVVGSTNSIGGTAAGAGNQIAFNRGYGVRVAGRIGDPMPFGNSILGNSIFSNAVGGAAGLGIDLVTCDPCTPGVTANDTGDGDAGPNGFQNFPVLDCAVSANSQTTIKGTLNSTAGTVFNVQFFSNEACDASGNGEGQTYLGQASVTTDGSGNVAISATLPVAVPAGRSVTATATGPTGSTSEFSACVTSTAPTLAINDVTVTEGSTGTTNAVFTVTLSGALGVCLPVTVNYATAPGTAVTPGDYATTSGTLTFTPPFGAATVTQTITVPIVVDTIAEPDETFVVNLSLATSPTLTNATITDAQGIGTITNDDLCTPMTLNPATLPDGYVGVSYSQMLTVTGGAAPHTFAVTAGALPTGLTLAPGGALSGSPTAAGTFSFTVTATDANNCPVTRSYSIVVNTCPAITVSPASLPSGLAGTGYSQTISATGGVTPHTFSISAGTLPAGLTLTAGGALSGTPTTAGVFTFTVRATDANGCTGTQAYTLVICATITVTPATLPGGFTAIPYSQTLSATGGTSPYTFAVTAGALPGGLTLTGAGILSGTPTAVGTFTFTVTATDTNGCTGSQSYTVIVSDCPAITVNPATLPSGLAGASYSQTITATGGATPHTFSVSAGTLPAGLTLTTGGALSGTPTTAGVFTFTVRATDANGCTGTRAYTLVICPTITVSPATLPNGFTTIPYSQTLTATGGATPHTFAVTTGALPGGLTLTGAGALSGTPTAAGTFTFTVTATDTNGCTGSQSYTVVISDCPAITVNPASLPSGLVGASYSQAVTATGGAAPYSFGVIAGALPAGLTLATDGTLSGTPTAAGVFTFTVLATDINGCTGTRAYSLVICATITLNPATLPNGFAGVTYSQMLTATSGTSPYTFAVTAGALPGGLSLTAAGVLSGMPAATGTFTFTVTATDANLCTGSQSYSLIIGDCPAITVTPATLPGGSVGATYSQTITATGGVGPYSFSVSAGTLPAGLTLAAGGTLAGTPTTAGVGAFTVMATDANGCTGAQAYTVVICAAITVNPASLPSGLVGAGYTQTITATGGVAPYSFSLSAGTLPAGLTLAADGTLAGTPTTAGVGAFTVMATDTNGCMGTRAYTLVICATITVTPATLPNGFTSIAYSQTLSATGGTSPYGFAVTAGALPGGLTLNGAGLLSGAPAAAGTFTFTVTATDANGCTGSQSYTVIISDCPAITVNPASLPSGLAGTSYSQTITATGGVAPHTFSISAGALPAGLTLSAAGILSGTPTASGVFNFTVKATDVNGCMGTLAYTLVICSPVTVNPASLPSGFAGVTYNQTLSASGGVSPYTFAVTGGALPGGLTLSSAGILSGAPTTSGTFTFTVTATDNLGCPGARSYTVVINDCPAITVGPASLPNGAAGAGYSQTVTAAGGTAPYIFSVSAGTLPPGLSFSAAGALTGTATTAGVFTFTVKATDANGCAGTRVYALAVCGTITLNPATLPSGFVDAPYSQTLTATGGTAPYTFALTPGPLPPGVTLAADGTLAGTPVISGIFNFTVTATDASGCTGTRSYSIVVNNCPTITVNPASLPGGVAGASYSQTITASGGASPYSFSVSAGTLPPGLTLASGGALTGTPTTAGVFNFTVKAMDLNSCMGTRAYTVTICPTITVNPASLPNGLTTVAYSQTITATGGTGPYTFAVTTGALPGGLTLGASGALTGTPTAAGTFNFTVTATDANGCAGTRSYSVVITACPTITVNPATLPNGLVSDSYNQTLTATGGTAPHTYAVTAGSLPTGLTLSTSGALTGTPTAAGTFNFAVTATDANGCTGSRSYSIVITNCTPITVNPASMPGGSVGVGYSQTVTNTGGVAPITFSVSAGTLPTGLTLASSGALTGTPTAGGVFNFTVKATDANGCMGTRAYTVLICATITVNPATLPSGFAGAAYNQTLTATGGTAPYTFALTPGPLPPGVSLATDGTLSGSPLITGTFNFTITATDANGCTGSRSYTIIVNTCPTVTVSPASMPGGLVGASYSQTITASGAAPPYTYSVSAGTLPPGLTLASGGALTGTPTTGGTFNFTVKATDTNGCAGTRAYTVQICPTITLTPASLPNGFTAVAYSQTLSATGGVAPYTYAVTAGTLPGGLTLTAAGALSGTPTAPGTFSFTVTATDANGCTGSTPYSVVISDCPAITVNPATLPDGFTAIAYSQTLTAAGGVAPHTFAVTTGALPGGLTLSASGALTGTPAGSGTFSFTVRVTDANGCTGSRSYTIAISGCPAVAVNPTSLPNGLTGSSYSQTIAATGGAAPYTFTVSAGTLPAGLTLAAGGLLSGTPTTMGAFSFTVKATDANGCMGTRAYTVQVCPAITVNPASLPSGFTTAPYSQTLTASGGASPYTFAVSSGALPPGITLTSAGALSGAPTSAGEFNFTVTATDANTCAGSRSYTIFVNNCPPITVSPASLPGGLVGASYSQTISATGSVPPYTFTVSAGTLPAGLTLSSGGALTGTLTTAGVFNFTVKAADANGCSGTQAYTVVICPTITVNPAVLPNGSVGVAYSQTLTAVGGTALYTYAVTAGAAPGGLSLTTAGVLSGSPAGIGTFTFTVTATDANGCPGTRSYTIVINNCPAITVNPASLPGGLVGTSYTQTITATGGAEPYTFSVSAGTLPAGLTLATGGSLTGTPTTAGTFTFTVTATDANGCTGTRAYTVLICPTITVNPASLPDGFASITYSQTLTASGGTAPYSFAVTAGALPGGLSLSAGGVLSGAPTAFGTFAFTVTATDANGCAGARSYSLLISNCAAITVNPASLPNGLIGAGYSQTFTATGGATPYTFAVSAGTLPAGLTLASSGALTGAPTAAGTFTFTVKTTDVNGCMGTRAYTLIICPTITVNPASLPNGSTGIAYSQTLTATGGTAPHIFAVTTGTLPGGLSLSAGGGLIGTPTAAGTFTFTVAATDANGCTGERSYTLVVTASGLMYYPLPRPIRLLETRPGEVGCDAPGAAIPGGTSRTQTAAGRTCSGITIPTNAKALTGNITTVQSGGGYLTLYPSDAAQPTVANSNYEPNEVLNNVFTVGLGATDGAFNIFVTSTTHIVVDVTGYYAPPGAGGLYFHPLPKPIRLLETRPGELGCTTPGTPLLGGADTPQQARLTCDGVTIPAAARAIVGNATTVNPGGGYLTLYPADATRPLVASSNYLPGQIMNGPFTVGLSPAGLFNIFVTTNTDLVIDVLGYYSEDATDVNGVGLFFNPLAHPVRLLETRDNPAFPGCYKPNAPIVGGVVRTQPARGVCDGLTIASNALGIVGNATVVNNNGGYLTFWPSDATQPLVATSNFLPGQIFNRHFTVGLSAGPGAFKIFSAQTTDLVIDVTGYFAP